MDEKRINLVKEILGKLKGIYEELRKITQEIESTSASYYENIKNKENNRMNEQLTKFISNVEDIKQQNYQITELINEWYYFINDENEINKVFFPLKFYFKRKKIKNKIEVKNQNIYKLSVEGRLIKEKITNIKRELELKAIDEIKKNGMYIQYENLLKMKGNYIRDLQFILPTLRDYFSQKCINLTDIDKLFDKISK